MKTKTVQTNFLSGVLDPRASARVEADAYNNGLLTGRNIELHHLGSVRRRRGLPYRAQIANKIERVTGITPTAPNGGTAANANDDNVSTLVTTTTPPNTTNEYVVLHYDLGSARTVVFADVLGISIDSGSTDEFCIQWSTDNSSWNNTSPSFASSKFQLVDSIERDYRRAPGVSARYWRVVRIGTTNLTGQVSISDFNLWVETSTVPQGRIISFEISDTERYALVVTHRSGVLFQDGSPVDYIPLPYDDEHIRELDADASDGEMVITHEEYQHRALFEDTDGNFQSVPVEATSPPQVDYNDTLSPTPTSEIQVITLSGTLAKGDTFQVGLEGARSAAIVYAGDSTAAEQAATAANFQREIQKLWSVRGFTGVSCARTGANAYTVTFAGASAKAYELMTVSMVTGQGTTSVSRSQIGSSRYEDMWSATRGWPRTVAFFEKRLYLGGTRSKQSTLIGSHVVDTANFDLGEGLADEAIYVTLSGAKTMGIQNLVAGDALQVFTTGAEARYLKRDGEPVTPADVPKNQTYYGSKRIRPVLCDSTTVYVHSTGKSLRDFRYDVNVDKYTSLSLTSLAPHLLNDVVDLAAWNGSREDELNYVFAVNSDGTVAVLALRNEVDLKALVQWTTQGYFRAVGVVASDIYFLSERSINGTSHLFLEQLEYDYYTDCSIQDENDPASDVVTGLGHLNGQECRVLADGSVLPNVTPSSGQATIQAAATNVEVGLNFDPEVTPMPLNTMTPHGSNFMDKRRVVKVRVKVRDTLGLLCNGNVLPDRNFDLNNFDTAPVPFTGVHTLEETTNWDEAEEKLVTFTQVDPLPMEILGLAVDMESA